LRKILVRFGSLSPFSPERLVARALKFHAARHVSRREVP
jgi:hypothetical protein